MGSSISAMAVATAKLQSSLAGGSATTAAVDTTGANFLRIAICCFSNPTGLVAVSDSMGNVYTQKGGTMGVAASYILYFYCASPVVGAGHTFTVTSTGTIFATMLCAAFSGVIAAAPVEAAFTNHVAAGGTTMQPGALTPGNNGAMLDFVVSINGAGGTFSCDSGFSLVDSGAGAAGVAIGGANFNLVQGAAAAVNPTFTVTGLTPSMACSLFAIDPASYTPPSANQGGTLPMMGVG